MKALWFQEILEISSLCFAAIFLFLFHSSPTVPAQKEEKKILILFPGQSDLVAYPLTEKGIESALAAGTEFRIELWAIA